MFFLCVAMSLLTCAGNLQVGSPGGVTADGGAEGSDGGGLLTTLPADGGLPCEVATLLSTHCVSCHGSPTSGGAPMSLLSRADLLASFLVTRR